MWKRWMAVLLCVHLLPVCAIAQEQEAQDGLIYTRETYVGADEWLGAYAFDGDQNQAFRSADAKVTWTGVTDGLGFQDFEGELADPVGMLHVTELPCRATCTIEKNGQTLTMEYLFEQGPIQSIEVKNGDTPCPVSEFGGYDVPFKPGEAFTLTAHVTLTDEAVQSGCTVKQSWSLWNSATEEEITTDGERMTATATADMAYSVCDTWIEVLDSNGDMAAYASIMCTLMPTQD